MHASLIQPGKRYRFAYPYWGAKFTDTGGLPEYEARRGAVVTVQRPCVESDGFDAECLPQFVIRDADGWEGHCDPSELVPEDTDDDMREAF
jgi:hypothetical protein